MTHPPTGSQLVVKWLTHLWTLGDRQTSDVGRGTWDVQPRMGSSSQALTACCIGMASAFGNGEPRLVFVSRLSSLVSRLSSSFSLTRMATRLLVSKSPTWLQQRRWSSDEGGGGGHTNCRAALPVKFHTPYSVACPLIQRLGGPAVEDPTLEIGFCQGGRPRL